ncbi:hypothetical protein KUTeg_004140 [Tegillarca granosa]|uniref:Uncharacterized protein n=1 Tax=Tegillarca granosa TaxID=220873 RepID=A0ABQ9FP46_TEGGR|nr:hypothetical protein KUTeg_004140 [Tegillarca granosa]
MADLQNILLWDVPVIKFELPKNRGGWEPGKGCDRGRKIEQGKGKDRENKEVHTVTRPNLMNTLLIQSIVKITVWIRESTLAAQIVHLKYKDDVKWLLESRHSAIILPI